eukprot:SAG31_NODE_1085_length_10006_cov_34.511154_3_plen_102_part_00
MALLFCTTNPFGDIFTTFSNEVGSQKRKNRSPDYHRRFIKYILDTAAERDYVNLVLTLHIVDTHVDTVAVQLYIFLKICRILHSLTLHVLKFTIINLVGSY